MAELRYSLLLVFIISACSQATASTKITINNKLSDCIQVNSTEVDYQAGIPMLEISHQKLKPISECGCRSVISEYTSELEMDGYTSSLLTAKLIFEANKFKIPLATSKKIIGDYSVLVNFSCSMPD